MHFAVNTAHTPGGTLNDPLSADILARARSASAPQAIIAALLGLEKIFGTDLMQNTALRAELLSAWQQLASSPALKTTQEFP